MTTAAPQYVASAEHLHRLASLFSTDGAVRTACGIPKAVSRPTVAEMDDLPICSACARIDHQGRTRWMSPTPESLLRLTARPATA